MLPLYSARVSDLKQGDFVIVECASCGHDGLIHPAALPSLGLGSNERIIDLAPRLRCRECEETLDTTANITHCDSANG